MKHSVFWKIIIGLLIFLTLGEFVMMFVMYQFTYNNAVEDATASIRYAASTCANAFEVYNPDDLSDYKDSQAFLNNICDGLDITYLYVLKPDLTNRDETYLATGYGKNASEEFVNNRYPGYTVKGKLRDDQIKIMNGEKEVMLHEKNQYDDTLICFMPVKRYYNNQTNKFVNEIKSMVCAEISLTRVMEKFNNQYMRFVVIDLIVAALLLGTTGIILYFRVSKPLQLISSRMKGFVSRKNEFFEKLPVKGKDEIAEMSDAFNTMAEEIDEFITRLAELNRQKAELNIAHNIQRGLLPPQEYQGSGVAINAAMLPAKDVGGDLYDYQVLENGNIFVTIADVSGKGITAALFMARAITLLHEYAMLGYSPGRMLFEYNSNLVARNPNKMFITTFVAVYNPGTGELTYANAGHNYPYILSDKLIKLEQKSGAAAGVFKGVKYPEHTIKMNAGDRLFLYTDGVTEAQNKGQELLGDEALEELLRRHTGAGTANLIDEVIKAIRAFADGAEQADDITMLTFRVTPDNN